MLHSNLKINSGGHLEFAGMDCVSLAEEYKTPLYLLDEGRIREKCRIYTSAVNKHFKKGSGVLYASKALNFKEVLRIINSEGLLLDVVSGGELHTAVSAGFPSEKIYFHGNNKTDSEIEYALDCKIGCFITDCKEELNAINKFAAKRGFVQKIIMRLTPGIDTHTYEAVRTGHVDSKFGTAIETGQAMELIRYALGLENIKIEGFHCHVGSQVFDSRSFLDSSDIMLDFFARVKEETGLIPSVLNLGGGYGVKYTGDDGEIDIAENIALVASHINEKCASLKMEVPKIFMEPGRSIVADAGITLYSVGTVKTITGYKNYVSVDGGMTDNPRFALYGSLYSALIANKADKKTDFECDIVGKCCESGDIIAQNIKLAKPVRGDILAVLVTGAYNYSMASNYNRIPRPPIVIIKDKKSRIALKRESYEDLIRNDI